MRTLAAYKGRVRSLSFSADGAYLASVGGTGQTVSLWHHATDKRLRLNGGHREPNWVCFAPQGTALAAHYWGGFWLWPDPLTLPSVGANHIGSALAFRPDGAAFLVAETEYSPQGTTLREVEIATGQERAGPTVPTWGRWLAWSPDTAVQCVVCPGRSGARLYRIRAGAGLDASPLLVAGAPTPAVFSPDSRTLTLATATVIHRWDVSSGEALPTLRGHERKVNAVAYLPDGRLLSCGNDGLVRTWDGERCVDAKDWQLGEVLALAVARDGMRAAVGSKSGTILIWDLD